KAGKKSLKTGFGYWHRNFNGSHYSISIPLIIPVTFTIGYLAGLLGVGGGFMKIPIMVLWFGVPAKIAIATSSLMVGLTGALGLGGHLFSSALNWRLAVELGIVVFIGGQIGSKISIGLSEKKIKTVLAYILLITGAYMIFRSVFL
ncbi:MAG TPA: sulfite exporter TauE/SafE family protein, partial [Ignavibacteria bacterium]|nr:sulfite exporter TauE/SafE family protein [Ignavibacteria bacterium]